jgi:hypothetical protein
MMLRGGVSRVIGRIGSRGAAKVQYKVYEKYKYKEGYWYINKDENE